MEGKVDENLWKTSLNSNKIKDQEKLSWVLESLLENILN